MVPECQCNQHIDFLNVDISCASRDLRFLPDTGLCYSCRFSPVLSI
jgi:hypothetical protein